MTDPTRRFSSRVDNYHKYRPTYPVAVLDLLVEECGLTTASVIADVGSGTGILSELFLRNGNRVFGVEPNPEMRTAGERLLGQYAHFTSVDGTAEATTLAAHSVDFVTAGQAFHWFDPDKARSEFARILKPKGWVALIWNMRRTKGTPFLEAFEQLWLRYGIDYESVRHAPNYHGVMDAFFSAGGWKLTTLENLQLFDFAGLKGRVESTSYAPEPGHTDYQPMMSDLAALFQEHQTNGRVRYEYDTMVYYGQLRPAA